MSSPGDSLQLKGIDHLELWVGNARQAAHYYVHGFGFRPAAYLGPETGVRDRCSYLLEQGKARLVITAALRPEGPVHEHVARHGDGVRDIAFWVDGAAAAFREAVRRGARPAQEPREQRDAHGTLRRAAIHTYGDTLHSFVERGDYPDRFAPGFEPLPGNGNGNGDAGLLRVDHVVGNVELGQMDTWVAFYRDVLGFSQFIHFDDRDISTDYSALMSKVMQDGSGSIKFPINEPAQGRKKSQIQEYLDFYGGPGVQHVALLTQDIVRTVRRLRSAGVEFLGVPHSYYEEVPGRLGRVDEKLSELEELGVLVDRDDEGYLLQLFSRPVQDRPTLFFEVIQRKGSRGFGKGNFRALFEAIEREQALRGNL
ncbi:MAG TPA: 4-hydroxyphenylpyruvate dioxygenase [Candidatus Saccharimonadales bacterium]|nr:4-hydroxyphenylpyruvate dioxygenase [Candidatus Saccharimonadales bacterium]